MPFCDIMGLFDYWRECPPVHLLVKNYLGYKATRPVDPMEWLKTMKAVDPKRKGHARKMDNAPEYLQQMAADAKKKAAKK